MSRLFLILLLVSSLFADVEINDWLVPIRIHYKDGKEEVAWTEYALGYETYQIERHIPISGKNVLFMNKTLSDSLWVSDSLYYMPDGFSLLFYERVISLNNVALVEVIFTDSLYPIGIFSDRVLRDKQVKLAKTKRPLEHGIYITDEEMSNEAYHIYIYNKNWTVGRVKKLLKTEDGQKEIEKAEAKGYIIVIVEASP